MLKLINDQSHVYLISICVVITVNFGYKGAAKFVPYIRQTQILTRNLMYILQFLKRVKMPHSKLTSTFLRTETNKTNSNTQNDLNNFLPTSMKLCTVRTVR